MDRIALCHDRRPCRQLRHSFPQLSFPVLVPSLSWQIKLIVFAEGNWLSQHVFRTENDRPGCTKLCLRAASARQPPLFSEFAFTPVAFKKVMEKRSFPKTGSGPTHGRC